MRSRSIAGLDLIDQLLAGAWGKAETWRLGNENSEDALTWNVVRSLQEAGLLHLLLPLLCDCGETSEPALYLWGRRIGQDGAGEWDELARVRKELEPDHRQQTEPDVVLHIDGWGWVFVEVKFGSPVTTAPSKERMEQWLALYAKKLSGLFSLEGIAEVPYYEFPEQLLRNVAFAHRVAGEGERAHVVLLARAKDLTPVEQWLRRCLSEETAVGFSRLSWEEIYRALLDHAAVTPLSDYLEGKSYSLRREGPPAVRVSIKGYDAPKESAGGVPKELTTFLTRSGGRSTIVQIKFFEGLGGRPMIDSKFNESAWVLRSGGTPMTADEVCRTINAQLGRSWSRSEISRALDELVRNALASSDSAGRYQWILQRVTTVNR